MQDQNDKYWEIKQWVKTNFSLIHSFPQNKSAVLKELQADFEGYAAKEGVDFFLKGKIPNQDLVISKSIYLASFLVQYCNALEKDDLEALTWINRQNNLKLKVNSLPPR